MKGTGSGNTGFAIIASIKEKFGFFRVMRKGSASSICGAMIAKPNGAWDIIHRNRRSSDIAVVGRRILGWETRETMTKKRSSAVKKKPKLSNSERHARFLD